MIIRDATRADVPELCALLNEIIAIGGSTALETPLDPEAFTQYFLASPDFVSCLVAEQDGLLGFQSLERRAKLPKSCVDIATFARVSNKVKGVGRALFEHTQELARKAGFEQVNATIRGDNVSGLGYYHGMGFVDYSVDKAVPLDDGTLVDRISKRFIL